MAIPIIPMEDVITTFLNYFIANYATVVAEINAERTDFAIKAPAKSTDFYDHEPNDLQVDQAIIIIVDELTVIEAQGELANTKQEKANVIISVNAFEREENNESLLNKRLFRHQEAIRRTAGDLDNVPGNPWVAIIHIANDQAPDVSIPQTHSQKTMGVGFMVEVRVPHRFGAAVGDIDVTPATDFSPSGSAGGPFTPTDIDYIHTNSNVADIEFSVSVNVPWLSIAVKTGIITAGSNFANNLRLNSLADSLAVGTHIGTVVFTNVSSPQTPEVRTVTLTVT